MVCRLYIPRFDKGESVRLLFDTGADRTCLNPRAIKQIGIPEDSLKNPLKVDGIGKDKATFYREPATLTFFDTDGDIEYTYPIELLIAEETYSESASRLSSRTKCLRSLEHDLLSFGKPAGLYCCVD